MKWFPEKCLSTVLHMVCLMYPGAAGAQHLLVNPGFELGNFVDRGDGFQILPNG